MRTIGQTHLHDIEIHDSQLYSTFGCGRRIMNFVIQHVQLVKVGTDPIYSDLFPPSLPHVQIHAYTDLPHRA